MHIGDLYVLFDTHHTLAHICGTCILVLFFMDVQFQIKRTKLSRKKSTE